MNRVRLSVRLALASGLLALASASSAFAGSASLVVPTGARVCLSPIYANQHVDAQGTASPGVRFMVVRNDVTIYQTADRTQGFGATFDRSTTPHYFPGTFKLCARNTGATSANVQMSITGY